MLRRTLPVMDSISSLVLSSGWSEMIELESETTETTSSELGSEECIEFRETGSEWSRNRNLVADEDSICILAMKVMKQFHSFIIYSFLMILGCFGHGNFRWGFVVYSSRTIVVKHASLICSPINCVFVFWFHRICFGLYHCYCSLFYFTLHFVF